MLYQATPSFAPTYTVVIPSGSSMDMNEGWANNDVAAVINAAATANVLIRFFMK
jgi:hypothetical protein